MKLKSMTTMESLFKTLEPQAKGLLNSAILGATACFSTDGSVLPVLLYSKKGKVNLTGVPLASTEDKDKLSAVIAALRKECEVVVFVVESWILGAKDPAVLERAMKEGLADIEGRQEVVMITLYLGKRTIVINAYIKRNPDGLGQWLVMSDNAQAHEQLEGRFV